ncbi:MAG: ATP-binding protein [Niastella sp.]|nr:ATP-binding protein [Niastella sp.]
MSNSSNTHEAVKMIAGSSKMSETLHRYPGLRPFISDEKRIFFGRRAEIEILLNAIRVNAAFILYSRSGLGKSSLIRAGLIPRLTDTKIEPVIIRFIQAENEGQKIKKPVDILAKEIAKKAHKNVNNFADFKNTPAPLLDMISKKPLLLIFDQFEELLNYSKEDRDELIKCLGAILDDNSREGFEHKDKVKLLFVIRSDRFILMKEVARAIPGILNNSYGLKPLSTDQAEEAIDVPSQILALGDVTKSFKIPPYEYDQEALKVILNTLKNKEEEIESSQLQIVCQELEEIAHRKYNDSPHKKKVTIKPADFGNKEGISKMLNRFYWKQIEKLGKDKTLILPPRSVRRIKTFIEDELVSGNKRIVQSEAKVKEVMQGIKATRKFPATLELSTADAIISKLLELRLIREEDSHLDKVYEISHDTLLPSIIESKKERAAHRQRIKFLLYVAGIILLMVAFIIYDITTKEAKIKTREAKIQQEFQKEYGDSLLRQLWQITKLNATLITQATKIKRLNDSVETANKNLQTANLIKDTANAHLAVSRDSVLNLVRTYETVVTSQKYDIAKVRDSVITQRIEIDSLRKVVRSLRVNNKDTTKYIYGGNPQLTAQKNIIQNNVRDLKEEVYEESWFKKGYFLQFDDMKVLLLDIDRSRQTIRVQICNMIGSAACPSPIATPTITVNQNYSFSYKNHKYNLVLKRIGAAGNNPLTPAAYIVFSKQ